MPAQPDPAAPFVIKETKVEGQADSLAERVSRRLGSDGDLSTRQAAATVRLAINQVPQIWKDGHVALGALWGLYSQYPYMPRLRDRTVLEAGVVDMPLLWEAEAFALAVGFDDAAGRYVGLWAPDADGKSQPPARTDSMLIVRPDIAAGQLDADSRLSRSLAGQLGDRIDTDVDVPDGAGTPTVDVFVPGAKTRFYGVKTLNSDKIALDFKNIADEVIANLRGDDGIQLTVRIEIEATKQDGFGDGKVRTVSENAKTLKFDQSGFEEG